ncbi:MAG: nucleoside recognition domain-containing protein [Bacillota bacterium]
MRSNLPSLLRSEAGTYLIGAALGLFTALVVVSAKDAFEASLFGLRLWFDAVLPALLPFFVLSEILAAYGVIHFMGVLMEPFMRPLFNIPGAGSFAFAMGLVSGYPLGAIITARLCRERLCNAVEGERLVSLANTADPLFMAGVVAAGFFQVPELGAALSAAHYLAVLLVGWLGAFHERRAPATPPLEGTSREPLLYRAATAMGKARREDGRPFGQVLGDAVKSAMTSMLLIGGTIMIFSVLLRVLARLGVVQALGHLAGAALAAVGLNPGLADAAVRGLFEITNGTRTASQAQGALAERAAVASFIIGWSGASVHAQVAAVVQDTGIRLRPYIRARFLHGIFAAAITLVLMASSAAPRLPVLTPFTASGTLSPWSPEAVAWRLRTAGLLLGLMLVGVATGQLARKLGRLVGSWPRVGGI